jgi:hypothetical protein
LKALMALALGGGGLHPLSAAQPEGAAQVIRPISVEGSQVARWVVATRDNGGLPFIVIDKDLAQVLIFNAHGQLMGFAPALLGKTRGDEATPGIGDRPLSEIGPAEKTTPAGRFLAKIGPALGANQNVLWVDFDMSVALHNVITTNPKERRIERLESATPKDNRITFGCINVPVVFYEHLVTPLFADRGGMVYILPDSKFLIEVFPKFQMFAPPIHRSASAAVPD